MDKNLKKKPEWWPENPYPSDIFTATLEDYKKVVPNENTRTAINGYLGRRFWDLASDAIWEAFIESSGEAEVEDEEKKHILYFLDYLEINSEWDWSPKWITVIHLIRSLVKRHQPRRTVSREFAHNWALRLFDHAYIKHTEENVCEMLSELGFEVKEKP
jgi:hypothetical protein